MNLKNILIKDGRFNPTLKNYIKQSLAMSWPMLVMMGFDFVVNITDVVIAGYLDKTVQASVGLAGSIYMFFTVIVQAITNGTVAVVSRTFGSPERAERLPVSIFTATTLAFIFALIFSVLAFILAPVFISLTNAPDEVKKLSVVLIRIYSVGMIFHLGVINLNGILRACRLMVISMKFMVLAALVNVCLNIILVFHTPLGFKGIALSTSISWLVAGIFIFIAVQRMVSGRQYSFDKAIAKKIISIAWPSGIVMFCWQSSALIVYWVMGQLPVPENVNVMAAFAAGLRIESIIFMPAFALNAANAVIIGNLLGEGKPQEAFEAGLATVIMGVCLILCLTVVVISCAHPIATLLAAKDSAGKADPRVVAEIVHYLRIVMLSEPFVACNAIVSGALIGAGDTRPIMRYTIISIWIVRLPSIYVGAILLGLGATGIWWGMNFTFLSQSALTLRRYLSKKWAT
jgi:putative MATE family efflux protein